MYNKTEGAVQWFRMSRRELVGFAGHGNAIYNITPLFKKMYGVLKQKLTLWWILSYSRCVWLLKKVSAAGFGRNYRSCMWNPQSKKKESETKKKTSLLMTVATVFRQILWWCMQHLAFSITDAGKIPLFNMQLYSIFSTT